MGNRGSKVEQEHRRIYIGDVSEIEEADASVEPPGPKSSQLSPTISEEPEIGVGETESKITSDVGKTEIPLPPPGVKSPEVKPTTRRNSIPQDQKGKRKGKGQTKLLRSRPHQVFPTNEIISSRYTVLTFIPKNLFEQFRRIVNFYFLCMAIIQTSTDSPVSPFTSGAPLVFVIVVTAIKQGYEDFIRHRADKSVNNRPVNVVINGTLKAIKAKELKVGDILRLEGEEQVPSDILVIGSSDEYLRCQITTANLDGETNLKMRYCPSALPPLKKAEDFQNLDAIIECEQPNSDLYSFNGSLLIPAEKMLLSGSVLSANEQLNLTEDTRKQSAWSQGSEFSEYDRRMTNLSDDSTDQPSPKLPSDLSNFFQIPLTMDNMVLRGTKVKNTEFVYGVVIYTGQDTRLAQNSKKTYTKFSTVEKSVNRFLMIFITILILIVCLCVAGHFIWLENEKIDPKNAWYLPKSVSINGSYIFQLFASFLILFNYIIPISLYVTIELQKFIGSKFFVWDDDLKDPTSGLAPLCNTSDLNEELGQIEYLFSDKTGTLTENVMQFRYCSINGIRYDVDPFDNLFQVDKAKKINRKVEIEKLPDVKKFLRTLCLCHTVQLQEKRRPSFELRPPLLGKTKMTEKMKVTNSVADIRLDEKPNIGEHGRLEYQASSPDEKALVEACFRMGVIYLGEREDVLSLNVFGTVEKFKRHYVLEFDADRKCMSVIVENSNGEYWLLTKGAESTILPRSESGPKDQTFKHVEDFALLGMRTLALAERKLTKGEFDDFSTKLKKARRTLKHREERMREVYKSVESQLNVLGATGVEDQLQEGVPETLTALNEAGIRIWMLTGDKLETAVNVAISCGLITQSSQQILLSGFKKEELIIDRLNEIKSEMKKEANITFVVDGESIQLALTACPDIFRDVAMQATRVVCCRMTPLQKAKVVSMVKKTPQHPVTAAVGDGANDVAMILEAHIGLAILGKEGRQAARSADFAFARFSFLKKIILVHGHWYYVRLATLGAYFFYKNVVFIFPQVYFCFHTAFSTQTLFSAFFLTMYNIFFSSCPIFVYGLQEQPYPAEILMANPHLYKEISRNRLLTLWQFVKWNLHAFWHSAVVYFIPFLSWSFLNPVTDWASFGTVVFSGVVAVSNMKLLLETKFLSWLTAFSYACSFISYFWFTAMYSELNLRPIKIDSHELRHTFFTVMGTFGFWLLMFLVTVTSLMPDYCIKAISNSWSTISTYWNGKSKIVHLRRLRRKTLTKNLPSLSMLFTKRTGKFAISSTTLVTYLSKEE